jgi:peptidoglycan/LPS O-acetylase OafA/YrhL
MYIYTFLKQVRSHRGDNSLVSAMHRNVLYRPEIDGLRAISVLSVMFFHAGFQSFQGGFVGVDVFFVISGYLITTIILADLENDQFSFLNFYERRARRILPPLFVVMILCVPVSWMLMGPSQFKAFCKSIISVSTFSSNILFAKEGNYFATELNSRPLLHTWSLSIEEQYYLIYPLLLIFLFRFAKKRITHILIVLIILSISISEWGWRFSPDKNFYLIPSRAWELLIGSLVALLLKHHSELFKRSKALNEILSLSGLGLILIAVFGFDGSTPFPSLYTLIPTVGTALLILYSSSRMWVGKLLSLKPIVFTGLLSYSLYLWHQPLFSFLDLSQTEKLSPKSFLLMILLSGLLAYLTWRFIENPFRNKTWLNRKQIFIFAIYGNIFFIFIGAIGLKWDFPSYKLRNYDLADSQYGGESFNWKDTYSNKTESHKVIVYGDSHARQYLNAFSEFAKKNTITIQTLMNSACISLPEITNIYKKKVQPDCLKMYPQLKEITANNHQPIFIIYRWSKTISDIDGSNDLSGGSLKRNEIKIFENRITASLTKLIQELGVDRKYIIFGNVPSTGLEKGFINCILASGTDTRQCHEEFKATEGEFHFFRSTLDLFSKRHKNVLFIDPYEALCDEKLCYNVQNTKIIYSDNAHLSVFGARKVFEHFEEKIITFLNN